ncbi:MAG TPA: sigma-70 family RNA polymerase sigma factor [Gemmataceae bacterium]|nr:sigma-70 family RNA polymerase sigma factor [Gemmataceae bacterium]
MPTNAASESVTVVRRLLEVQALRHATDAEVVGRFSATHDDAAFRVIAERHGPMVLAVCRRALGCEFDAEDAAQATFLVFARTAGSIRRPESLGSWLHGVAVRVSRKVLRARARRQHHESAKDARPSPDAADAVTWAEVKAGLDEELRRLPPPLADAVVCCYLEGKTRDEAAHQLGLTPGSLHGRLERARKLLAARLTARGLTLSAALVAAADLPGSGTAIALLAEGRPEAEFASPRVTALADSVLKGTTMGQIRAIAATTVVGLLIGFASWAATAAPPSIPRAEFPVLAPVRLPDREPPEHRETSLLLIEDVAGPTGTVDTRRLVRVRFKAGVPGKPEVLYSADQRFFGHFGGHRVHDHRYVVTRFGSVLDLKNNAWIHKELDGDVRAVEGGRVIYGMANVTKPEGVFAFDLAKKTVEKLADHGTPAALVWYGHRSPDGKRAIYPGQQTWELTVLGPGEKVRSLGAGFGCSLVATAAWATSARDLPILWLDDDTILTTTANDRLVSVNVADGSRTDVVRIKPEPNQAWVSTPPTLSRDEAGTVVYHCGRQVYRIDVAKKTYEGTDRKPLGHGFESTQTTPWKMEQIVFRRGKELVRVPNGVAAVSHVTPAAHYVAMVVRENNKVGKEAVKVRVWSAATDQWVTLDVMANSIVGWVGP